jgi:hypothetical protein
LEGFQQCFLVTGTVIGPVGLVEVDIICVQSLQAGFNGAYDVVSVQSCHPGPLRALDPAVAWTADFRGHDDGIAPFGFHPATDELLGAAGPFFVGWHRIVLSGVEKIDARVKGLVQYPKSRRFVRLVAESHGPHANL